METQEQTGVWGDAPGEVESICTERAAWTAIARSSDVGYAVLDQASLRAKGAAPYPPAPAGKAFGVVIISLNKKAEVKLILDGR